VLRFVASEWLLRSMQLTQIAAQTLATDKHAILCGYGRTGQYLARFLEAEGISFMALDLDPERVREAASPPNRFPMVTPRARKPCSPPACRARAWW
jgi:CPA2 family monovalent cation:H+ antiporter-2